MSANLGQLAAGVRAGSGLAGLAAASPSSYSGALSSLGSSLGSAANGLGIVGGLEQGGVSGDAGAAINAGQLANRFGAFGSSAPTAGAALGTAGGALNIYNGLEQGGVSGYGQAGVGALQTGSGVASLAGDSALSGTLGTAAGALAVPLDVYNEVNNWKSGATTSDAMAGVGTGAAVGSFFGPIGTGVGALIGGAAGALTSAFGPGEKDPETSDVQNVINATSSNGNNSAVAATAQDPYLELAGLMDDRSSTLPEYQQYGRMGEQAFTTAMTQQINQAVAANPSLASDPDAVYNQVVAPWVNSMGSGYSNVGSAYTATNEGLLQDMTQQYLSGDANTDWKAVGGDDPFSNIYQGTPLAGTAADAAAQNQLDQNIAAFNAKNPQPASSARATGTQQRAKGGHIMRKVKKADGGRAKRKSVLDSIRPNFKDAPKEKEHFDGGGYVGYFTPDTGYNPSESFNPNLQDVTNPDLNEVTAGNDTYLNAQNDPNAYANTGSSGGGGLAGLAKAAAPYAALVPLLGAVASKLGGSGSSSGSTSLPAGQSTSAGPFQAQASPRTMNAVDPNTDWYTYGEHPETQFYNDNSIGPLMGQFAAQPTAGSSSPSGASPTTSPAIPMPAPTATAQPVGMNNPRPTLKAAGGALDTLSPDNGTAATGQSRHVSGAGDGTSDDIDAKLSDGEYVIDANTVSMLGNGSNKAGAARLDQLRENLRKHAAKPMAKGKQFMKAKAPEAYMRGGSK